MPIIVRGKTKCLGCGKAVEEGDAIVGFPPFVTNEADPLWQFNDAVLHEDCLNRHPLADRLHDAYAAARVTSKPNLRECAICRQLIDDPDEHFPLGWLSSDDESPLADWNTWQAHRSCLAGWARLPHLLDVLQRGFDRRELQGVGVERLIADLESYLPAPVHSQQNF